MRCDFCLAPDPIWDYPAAGGPALPNGPFDALADDGYAACAACAELIEAGNWPTLTAWIVEQQPIHVPEGTSITENGRSGVVRYPGDRDHRMQRAALAVITFVTARDFAGPRKPL